MLLGIFILLYVAVLVALHRHRRNKRTTALGLTFRRNNMGTPVTATFAAPDQLGVVVNPLQASGVITPGAVLTNVVATSSDLTVFSTGINSDNAITLNAQATATATATLTVAATVTDPDGTVTNLTVTAAVTVTVAVSAVRTVSLGLVFSTITPAA